MREARNFIVKAAICPFQLKLDLISSLFLQKGKIKPVHIVDVPGHPKLRPQLEELLPKSCCLVFLVDALDFMPHKEAAAEYGMRTLFLSRGFHLDHWLLFITET